MMGARRWLSMCYPFLQIACLLVSFEFQSQDHVHCFNLSQSPRVTQVHYCNNVSQSAFTMYTHPFSELL